MHQQASSAIRSWTLAATSFAILAGCGSVKTVKVDEGSVETLPPLEFELPPRVSSGLTIESEGVTVEVGDKIDDVMSAFPRPSKSYPILDPPEQLEGQLSARGWQGGGRAVGVLGRDGRMALLLEIWDRVDDETIDAVVNEITAEQGRADQAVTRGDVRYWFWIDGEERIMISTSPDEQGQVALCRALGLTTVMDRLRMDPVSAQTDAADAMTLLSKDETDS